MLRIAICDDNEHVCAQMAEFCGTFLNGVVDHRVLVFNNGLQLINCRQNIDILFLDIGMPFLDGFDIAKELNKRSVDTRIIFLTCHAEMMQKAFEVKPFRYLVKPVTKKEIKESLADAIKDINRNAKIIVDHNTSESRTDIVVFEKDIICIEALGDGSVVYTVHQGSLVSRKPLKYWLENLKEAAFFQTHKSFIVSMAHVAGVRKNSVTTTSGIEIPLAKRKIAMFRTYVTEFIKSIY